MGLGISTTWGHISAGANIGKSERIPCDWLTESTGSNRIFKRKRLEDPDRLGYALADVAVFRPRNAANSRALLEQHAYLSTGDRSAPSFCQQLVDDSSSARLLVAHRVWDAVEPTDISLKLARIERRTALREELMRTLTRAIAKRNSATPEAIQDPIERDIEELEKSIRATAARIIERNRKIIDLIDKHKSRWGLGVREDDQE